MDGFSGKPKLVRAAFVELSERFIGAVPNVIVFQYNPAALTRNFTVWTGAEESGGGEGEEGSEETSGPPQVTGIQMAQPFDPEESMTVELILDASDDLADPDSNPVAVISGVADRIAALEMLLYPDEEGSSVVGDLVGTVSSALGGESSDEETETQRVSVPILLFFFGPGRIVPVRLTSFSVEEQFFSPTLYPTRAKVSVGIKVLIPENLAGYEDGLKKEMAINAYEYTKKQKGLLAMSNNANSVESMLAMMPF